MPGKIWTRDEKGKTIASFQSSGATKLGIKGIGQASALDHKLDDVLDSAFARHAELSNGEGELSRFTSAWAVGESFRKSDIVHDEAVVSEGPDFLWEVMSKKSSACKRSNGQEEENWKTLRPSDTSRDRGMDYWQMCIWLAEQEYFRAQRTFDGKIKNVWSMLGSPTLKPLVLREALCDWLDSLDELTRQKIVRVITYRKLLKQLRHRWPARGVRSALLPIHYSQEDLVGVLAKTIELEKILGEEWAESNNAVRSNHEL